VLCSAVLSTGRAAKGGREEVGEDEREKADGEQRPKHARQHEKNKEEEKKKENQRRGGYLSGVALYTVRLKRGPSDDAELQPSSENNDG
jgi:hypothetical protein